MARGLQNRRRVHPCREVARAARRVRSQRRPVASTLSELAPPRGDQRQEPVEPVRGPVGCPPSPPDRPDRGQRPQAGAAAESNSRPYDPPRRNDNDEGHAPTDRQRPDTPVSARLTIIAL